MVTITTVDGTTIKESYGNENRCDNCGKQISKAKSIITGGSICDEEWACCIECADEMEEKGCCFVELGDGVYRKQKY